MTAVLRIAIAIPVSPRLVLPRLLLPVLVLPLLILPLLVGCPGGGESLSGLNDDAPPAMLGTLERHRADLSAPQSEQLQRIDVREGDQVRAGQVLAQLDTRSADAQLQAATAHIAAADAQLAELVHGPRVEAVLEARARLASADARLQREDTELRRLHGLLTRKLISRSLYDDRQLSRDAAHEARKETQAQLQVLLAGSRIEQVDRARAERLVARAELQHAQVARDQLTLVAPAAARVEALPYRVGERPAAGAPIVQLILEGVPFARVYVPAEQRAAMAANAQVVVTAEGHSRGLVGRVRFVASEASFTPYFALTQRDRGHLVYLAEIDVPAAHDLVTGLPVEVHAAPARSPRAPGDH